MGKKAVSLVLAVVALFGLASCTSNRNTLCKNHPNNKHCQGTQ